MAGRAIDTSSRHRGNAMARKLERRKHEVHASLENFQLAKAKSALTLQIFDRTEKLGELQVGRGSLYWWGKHKQKAKRVAWSKFTDAMNRIAYGDEK